MKKNIIALTMICMALCATQVMGTANNKMLKILKNLEQKIIYSEESNIKNGGNTIEKRFKTPIVGYRWQVVGNKINGDKTKNFYSIEAKLALKIIKTLKETIKKREQKKNQESEKRPT